MEFKVYLSRNPGGLSCPAVQALAGLDIFIREDLCVLLENACSKCRFWSRRFAKSDRL